MNSLKLFYVVIGCILGLYSCNDNNSLKPANAEKVIREFIASHQILNQQQKLNTAQIILIEQPNIYSQFYTSVRVSVLDSSQQRLTLLFDFNRSPKNKWHLQIVESADKNEELKERVIAYKNLKIPAQ